VKNENQGMTVIVKTTSRIVLWVTLLYGIYIILHGHLSPGGGFGGGVVLALGLLSIMLAFGRSFTLRWLNIPSLERLEALAPVLFLAVGLIGMAAGGAFLFNFLNKGVLFELWSSGMIPILNIVIGFKVGLSLFLVVWALAEWDPGKDGEQ
jgi:multisubunit Na+/H+ antiporter MnhB subunit